MATETGDSSTDTSESSIGLGWEFSSYMRSITVTTLATLFGVLAAILSVLFATANGQPDDVTGGLILLAAVLVQFPLYKFMGIDVEDFGVKDQLYVAFMTFALWFVTWSLLLTTGGLQ